MLTNDSKGYLWLDVTGPNTSMLMTSRQAHTVSSLHMYCSECCKNPAFMFVRDRKNQNAMAVCWGYEMAVSMLLSGKRGFKTPSTKHCWLHCNCKGNVTYNEQNIMLSQLRYACVANQWYSIQKLPDSSCTYNNTLRQNHSTTVAEKKQ